MGNLWQFFGLPDPEIVAPTVVKKLVQKNLFKKGSRYWDSLTVFFYSRLENCARPSTLAFLARSELKLCFWGPGGTSRVARFADFGKDVKI